MEAAIHTKTYLKKAVEGLVESESCLSLISKGLLQLVENEEVDESDVGHYVSTSIRILVLSEDVKAVQQKLNALVETSVEFKDANFHKKQGSLSDGV